MANEKRLIDANEFLKALNERPLDFLDVGGDFGYFDETIDSVVNEQHTVDAVEVVRCKDCKHDNMTTCPLCWIEKHTLQFINHDPEFYCGNGERRTDDV